MTPQENAKIADVPNVPKTPQRTFRVPDEVWEPAKLAAAEQGETVTDVLVRALAQYVQAWRETVGDDE